LYFSDGTKWNTTLKPDYQLWSWGGGSFGRLALNSTTSYSTPQQEVCGGINWCAITASRDVSAGVHALKDDGTLWNWGRGLCGQLGLNNVICYSTPQQEVCGGTTWCTLSSASYSTMAIKTDGTLWSWGSNGYGRLGTNNAINYSTPTQEHCGGTTWCMVSGGSAHTLAIKTDGTLWGWGSNTFGQLGTNNQTSYSTPTQEVCGGTNWCMVSVGCLHNSVIKTDGTLWSWGRNLCGGLGLNNITDYSTPQQEACGGTNWCMVSAGESNTSSIKTDGTLWSWGLNDSGQLGTNNTTIYSTPQQEVCGGTNWCASSFGFGFMFAIKTDGTLWSWGCNYQGRLGLNNAINYSAPQQEACGFSDWCFVTAGGYSGHAIRAVQI
jgi:alpha-tubulin suppressor-like RCC1 family protein